MTRHVRILTAALAAALLVPAAALASDIVRAQGPLTDLHVDALAPDPTDGASARVQVVPSHDEGSTSVTLQVRDLDAAAAGRTLGAHLHTGPCESGNGAAAGPHFNIEVHDGTGTAVSDTTEVWLDIAVTGGGTGSAATTVPWLVPPGAAQSVVLHALPTAANGAAGARLACIPIEL